MIAYSWAQFGNDVVLLCGVAIVITLLIWVAHIAIGTDEQVKK